MRPMRPFVVFARAARARARMFPAIALIVAVSCQSARQRQEPTAAPTPDAHRIQRDIAYLADDRLEGRGTGTAGNDSAAAYIARRDAALGLEPLATDTSRAECRGSMVPASCRVYRQRFVARSAELAHNGRPEGVATQNVVALVPGRDPALRGEYVVIGAHFDHLGRSTSGAMDPEAGEAIRNGADDNASGSAAVLELARLLAAHPARRSVVVAHFSGEELGLLGSQWLVEHSPVPLDSVVAMLNFDMVGRLKNDKLIVYGVATASELPAILERANVTPKFNLSAVGDGYGPSDQSSFYAKGIPVLHFFTDLHEDYHRATDDADKIDSLGTARVVAMAERVVRDIADRDARLTPVRVAAPAPVMSSGQGSNSYLGSIPDMSGGDVPGLRLAGVRAGSPADVGGLKAGDVIVEFGDKPVKDIYSYSAALYGHKPGDRVTIEYLRDGERRTTSVTLGTRGQ
jgi:aminopeptidase YwaD